MIIGVGFDSFKEACAETLKKHPTKCDCCVPAEQLRTEGPKYLRPGTGRFNMAPMVGLSSYVDGLSNSTVDDIRQVCRELIEERS